MPTPSTAPYSRPARPARTTPRAADLPQPGRFDTEDSKWNDGDDWDDDAKRPSLWVVAVVVVVGVHFGFLGVVLAGGWVGARVPLRTGALTSLAVLTVLTVTGNATAVALFVFLVVFGTLAFLRLFRRGLGAMTERARRDRD